MEINVGVCKEHERPYEALCRQCEVIVCPSCVLFGNHKKHDIVSFRDGAMWLRKQIDNYMVKGIFKKEFSESKVLEIKQALLLLEKNRAETIKAIEQTFKGISGTLKIRKQEIINELEEKYAIEKDKIDNAEADWECKQEICEKLRLFDKEENNSYLLLNSKFILEGIKKISEPTQFNELNIYNNFDSSLYIDIANGENEKEGKTFSLDDIAKGFETYCTLLEAKIHSYNA